MSKLTSLLFVVLSLALCSCMAPVEGEDDPMAVDFYGNVISGVTWSSPAGTAGLGGYGHQVGIGELELENMTAQEATLTLGIRNLTPNVAFGDGRLYAQIVFGIGSATETVLLDWTNSMTITLPAGKVNVTAIQADAYGHPAATDLIGLAPVPAQTINVPLALTASLAAGPRSSLAMPTFSQTLGIPPGGGAFPLRPPQRARRVLVGDVRGQAGSDLNVMVGGSLSFNLFQLGNAADSLIRTEGVVLPGGDDIVSLTSAAGVLGIPICWLLDG